MNNRPNVQHPLDPAIPEFDFAIWRAQRRLVSALLRSLAEVEDEAAQQMLRGAAGALDAETLTEREVDAIGAYLEENGHAPPGHVMDLYESLLELADTKDAPRLLPEGLGVVRPNWEAIPFQRPVFDGAVSGANLRARLEETRTVVPPYRLTWLSPLGQDGRDVEMNVRDASGRNSAKAASVWDWLFARRLTLLGLAGVLPWPDPARPPLRLPDLPPSPLPRPI